MTVEEASGASVSIIKRLEIELAEAKFALDSCLKSVDARMVEKINTQDAEIKRLREALRQVAQFAGQFDFVKGGNLQTAVIIARAALGGKP